MEMLRSTELSGSSIFHMKPFAKTVGFTLLVIGFLCPGSFGSTNVVETYASRIARLNPAPNAGSSVYFVVQTEEGETDSAADSISGGDSVVRKAKDPFRAFVYALVPGAVVHGAGHFYAGKTGTGLVLLGSELAGATLLLVSVGMSWEEGSQTLESFPVAFAGGALFFGSWIYDMIGAPLAVQRENRGALQGKRPVLGLRSQGRRCERGRGVPF